LDPWYYASRAEVSESVEKVRHELQMSDNWRWNWAGHQRPKVVRDRSVRPAYLFGLRICSAYVSVRPVQLTLARQNELTLKGRSNWRRTTPLLFH